MASGKQRRSLDASRLLLGKKRLYALLVFDRNCKSAEENNADVDLTTLHIPGMRYFKEWPSIAAAFSKLCKTHDVMIMDVRGILHPLRIGRGSHVGVALKVPTRKAICISPGHGVSLEAAVEMIKEAVMLPRKIHEQLHLAGRLSQKMLKSAESA